MLKEVFTEKFRTFDLTHYVLKTLSFGEHLFFRCASGDLLPCNIMRLCWGFQIQSGHPHQALHCLGAIIALGLLPALAIRPAKRSLNKGEEPSANIARVCDATLLLLLASHFLAN